VLHLAIQEGSNAATRPLALNPTSLPWRGPVLTCVLWLQTAPTSVVGSSAGMCPMALHGPWVVEIKEVLATTACSEAHVFPRHSHALPRRLQDVRVDGVIVTYKPCRQALQHCAIVHRHAADHS
jgi:hypothetical protein